MVTVNAVYFSDGYGVKKIDIANLVGESQSQVSTILSVDTTPSIESNNISALSGEYINTDGYLTFAFGTGIGINLHGVWDEFNWGDENWDEGSRCMVVKNETTLNEFEDGYATAFPQINDRGILYVINRDTNAIDVFYGATFRPGMGRVPDYIYNTTSTPALFPGTLSYLYIVSNASSLLANGTRLYIGTSLGLTVVDGYDSEISPGYSKGEDNFGQSRTYGIIGSGATHEIIGGIIPNVVAISSVEDASIMLVATGDGLGNGGLTQITFNGNRKLVYMTQASGFLPSDDIRNISGKL